MASQESPVRKPSWAEGIFFKAGLPLSERLLERVLYQGAENIKAINERLGQGGSVLLVSDHPGTLETIYTAGLVPQLTNRKRTGVIVKEAFVNGEMGIIGKTAINILEKHNAEPIAVKTPKYEDNEDVRHDFNMLPVRKCIEILKTDGGLLLTFASGTRSKTMIEAEEGLNFFSPFASMVVPLTTVTEKGRRPTIMVHEPIPGKTGVKWCIGQFGKELGRQVFNDLIMTIIATGQPNEKIRGFYQEFCRQLEDSQINGGLQNESENPRIQKVIMAYKAWRNGEFN